MKILQINKFHYPRAGAEKCYFDTAQALKEQGHEVAFFAMRHPKNEPTRWSKYFVSRVDYDVPSGLWQKIKMGLRALYNREAARNLEQLIKDFKPDVAHLHNIYHQLSPSVIYVLKKHKIPMIMTLHDYKLICPNYKLFHQEKVTFRGCGKKYYQCFLDKCIKNSWSKSLLAVVEVYLHNKILRTYQKVDYFIAPSQFMKKICVRFNVPREKIKVIPNFIVPKIQEQGVRENIPLYILYFGRLSEEKGVEVAIKAMQKVDSKFHLKITGTGPEAGNLNKLVHSLNLSDRIEFTGHKTGKELDELVSNASAVVVPSVWLEVFGYAILEALAQGKIVIASRIGGIPEIITAQENGFLFEAGDSDELANKIKQTFNLSENDRKRIIKTAKENLRKYSERDYYNKLMEVYRAVSK